MRNPGHWRYNEGILNNIEEEFHMTDSLAASRIRRLIGAGLAMTKLLRGNAGGYMPKYNLTGYTHLLVHHGDRYYAYPGGGR